MVNANTMNGFDTSSNQQKLLRHHWGSNAGEDVFELDDEQEVD
jgi:hypothetical protein